MPEPQQEKKRKRTKVAQKADDHESEGSILLDEVSINMSEDYKAFKNKKAFEALFHVATCGYALRAVLVAKSSDTLQSLADCFVQRFQSSCTIMSGYSCNNIPNIVRSATKIFCSAITEIFEGEVTNIKPIKDQHDKIIHLEVTLKTLKASKAIKVSSGLASAFEVINIGDAVYIDPSAGIIKRLGRGEGHANEYDLECDKYVQVPKGSINVQRTHEKTLSLYSMDYLYSKEADIDNSVRQKVDDVVEEYFQQKVAHPAFSLLIVRDAGSLEPEKLIELSFWISKYPWLRVLLVGEPSPPEVSLKSFLWIEADEIEDKMAILLHHDKKISDPEYAKVVKEYVDKYAVNTLLSVIQAAPDALNFKKLMSIFT